MRQPESRRNLKHSRLLGALALGALALAGCEGSIPGDQHGPGDPGGPGTPGGPAPGTPGGPAVTPENCAKAGPQAGPERIYRLTPSEYRSSLRELRGDDTLDPELDADRES